MDGSEAKGVLLFIFRRCGGIATNARSKTGYASFGKVIRALPMQRDVLQLSARWMVRFRLSVGQYSRHLQDWHWYPSWFPGVLERVADGHKMHWSFLSTAQPPKELANVQK